MTAAESLHRAYLDYAATTPVDPRVVEAMLPYLTEHFGNPSSLYGEGREAASALDRARRTVMEAIGASLPTEVIFTSGGTESDDTAVLGIARASADRGRHVIVSAFEHRAVLEPAERLARDGFEVSYLRPRPNGVVHPDDLERLLRADTVLVSIMHANNEIGTVQPVADLAARCRAAGARFHTDAAQSLGKIPFDVAELGVDAASFAGHKLYAPKGVGVLYLREGTPFRPLMLGGGQEFGRRSGTQNVAAAVAFAEATRLAVDGLAEEATRLEQLRDRIVAAVLEAVDGAVVHGADAPRVPTTANIAVPGVDAHALLLQLDARGVAVSTGSACAAGSHAASHVLEAIGCPPDLAEGSLRVSVGRPTTERDVQQFESVFPEAVSKARHGTPGG